MSGLEIETQIVGGGGGPQAGEAQLLRPFFFERIYPNPTKGVLKIRFNSPDERSVTVKIYDVVGRLLQQESLLHSKVGMNEFFIKPKDLCAGVYFVRLETEGYAKTEKIILLR